MWFKKLEDGMDDMKLKKCINKTICELHKIHNISAKRSERKTCLGS